MRRASMMVAVACAMAMALAAFAQEDRLLPNPGFEELGEDGMPAGWEVAEGCRVLGAEDAHEGEHAIEVRYGSGVRVALPVHTGEVYRLEGYTRRPPGVDALRGRVLVRWLAEDGSKVAGNTDYYHTAAGEWSRFIHTIEIPAGCVTIHLVVDGPYLTEDWFRFDSLSLVKADRLHSIDPVALEIGARPLRAIRIADCHSFALLRLPYYMDAPCDGKVETAATMRAYRDRPNPHDHCDFDFSFHRDELVSAALIQTVASPLQRATLYAEVDGDWREVASLTNDGKTLLGARFGSVTTRRMRLRVHKSPEDESITVNEVQFFGTPVSALMLRGNPFSLQPTPVPPDVSEHVGALNASEHPKVIVAGAARDEEAGLRAGETLEVFSDAFSGPTGVSRLEASLVFAPATGSGAVEIAVLSPNIRDRNVPYIHKSDRLLSGRYTEGITEPPNAHYRDLCRVVAPIERGEDAAYARLGLTLPGTLVRPGERLWLRVTPLADATLRLPGSYLHIETSSVEDAFPEYLPDLHRIVRRAYAECTEAHVYDGAQNVEEFALVRLINEYLALDPGNREVNLIRDRVLRIKRPVELARPGPPDAPEWAFWQHRLLQEYLSCVHWWIDNRQLPNGELNGYLEDDTELSCEWGFLPLATGDEKTLRALDLIAEAVWNVIGEGGYSQFTMDAEHAGEYAGLTQTFMMLLHYGNPRYLERCLMTSKNIEWWTALNDHGDRHFRSYMFNASRVDDSEGKDIDHACNAYAMKPAFYASWYSANVHPREWMVQWARGWARAAMSEQKGKPAGALPYDILGRTGEIAPYCEKWNESVYYRDCHTHVKDLLFGAWDWSGDASLVAPLAYQGATVNEPDAMWRMRSGDTSRDQAVIAATDQMIAAHEEGLGEPGSFAPYNMYSELRYYWAWWASRDMRYLVEGLKEQCRNMERMRWLITEAEPYTDRAYLPGDRLLPFMMLGGSGGEVRGNYPDFAVSWEGIGTDVATLVTERSDTGLTVLAYSFADEPIEAIMRVWSLPHGRYEVSVGAEEVELELWRYQTVPVRIAPGATTTITVRQIEALDDIRDRADLALEARDIAREGDELLVTVHNIGAADAPAGLRVVAHDEDGQEVASAQLPAVPAPVLCVRSTVRIRLPARGAATVAIDPGEALAEITDVNNGAAVPQEQPPQGAVNP